MIRRPRGQGSLVIVFATGLLLVGAGLLWGWLAGQYDGAAWLLILTIATALPVSGLLWWAWWANRGLLEGDRSRTG